MFKWLCAFWLWLQSSVSESTVLIKYRYAGTRHPWIKTRSFLHACAPCPVALCSHLLFYSPGSYFHCLPLFQVFVNTAVDAVHQALWWSAGHLSAEGAVSFYSVAFKWQFIHNEKLIHYLLVLCIIIIIIYIYIFKRAFCEECHQALCGNHH